MIINNDVKKLISERIKEIGDFIGKTLGPNGKNIAIIRQNVYLINDGYSVCKSLEYDDPYGKVALMILLEGARLTSEMANDGTTSTICLASELIYNMINIFGSKIDNKTFNKIINVIEKHALSIIDKNTIVINGNKKIEEYLEFVLNSTMGVSLKNYNEIIIKVLKETYNNGIINIRPTFDDTPSYEILEGFVFEKGFVSQYLSINGTVILNNPYVILLNDSIKTINELEKIIYEVKKTKEDLFIVANSFSKEVIDYMIYLRNNHKYNICACISPEYGERQMEKLDDLAVYLNTNVMSNKDISISIGNIGVADRIEVTKERTIIFKSDINKDRIVKRIEYLKSLNSNKYIKERIAGVNGKIAYINVPMQKDYEYELYLQKIKNGIGSCISSLDYGVINGSYKILSDISNISEKELLDYGISNDKELINKIIKYFLSFKVILRFVCYNNLYKDTPQEIGCYYEEVWDSAYYTKVICLNAIYALKLFASIDGIYLDDKTINIKTELE